MLSRSGNLAPETVQEYSQMFFSKPNYHFQFSIVRRRAFTWMDGWIRGLARISRASEVAYETVQETSLGYAGGKPNPLNPPYQGDFPLNSPLIRGLSTQFPPYQGTFHSIPPLSGDFPLNSPLIRGTFHSIPPLSGGLSTQFPPDKGG